MIERVRARIRAQASYANVAATLALFVALGGTSYAALHIRSGDVADNTLRSRDIRDNTIRSRDVRNHSVQERDVRHDSLGTRAVKESALGKVPRAAETDRVGGASAQSLRVKCPADTVAKAGVCIETSPRAADGFLGAINQCDQANRSLVTMPQLDRLVRSTGPLSQSEWTASVYRNPDNGPNLFDQLETVLLDGGAEVSYDRVYLAVQHAFRCVALPSN
ncbi:MAG: hypothetical protein QOD13_1986 [Thermoleophilaceae bacterium]|jgi:hypothetical protein|nr:hypothetical protein [Thermoleophilaceae bacterium]